MGSYAEIVIAFAMIGLLGLILRFTFGRELPSRADRAAEGDDATFDFDDHELAADASRKFGRRSATPAGEDFGLLAPVAVTADEDEAALLKTRLGDAHIRATTTRGHDGRYRVLVFSTELDQARRVAGGAA